MEAKDEIKQRLDVAELVGSYLELKPAGSGSFKALCPFHGEKSPSFYVSQEKEIWHCFGCDKGGDIFSFVMELEGMTFPEALRFLGKKAGVEIPEYRPQAGSVDKTVSLDLQDLATKFYEKLLWEHADGKVARDYLVSRGIPEELAKKFRLGYAPDRWDALATFFRKRNVANERLVKAGLAKNKKTGQGVIDQFRHRLLVPLCDRHGAVLGFTGRQLGDDAHGPKYLNTPETEIYHKSKVLFGLDLAKTAIRQNKSVIIVEGNLDVVASHKAGVENIVASSGTALTEDHLRMLKKVTNKLLFCFDGDSAGFAAAQRGIHLAQNMSFDIAVIEIAASDGKDPDDLVQKDPKKWVELTKNPVHIMQYYFNKALSQFDLQSSEGKRDFVRFLLKEIQHLQDPIEKNHWLQRLADSSRTDVQILRSILEKQPIKTTTTPKKEEKKAEPIVKKEKPKILTGAESRLHQASNFLVGVFLQHPDAAKELIGRIDPNHLPEEPWRRIYKKLVLLYTNGSSSDSEQISIFSLAEQAFSDQVTDMTIIRRAAMTAQDLLSDLTRDQVLTELNRHISILTDSQYQAKRQELLAAIRQAESNGDAEGLKALMEQYTQLLK